MHLTDDELHDITIDAARSLFPPENIGNVSGSVGVAFNGEEAYHFVVHLDQVDDREEAARLRIGLRLAIRDRLLAEGDERSRQYTERLIVSSASAMACGVPTCSHWPSSLWPNRRPLAAASKK